MTTKPTDEGELSASEMGKTGSRMPVFLLVLLCVAAAGSLGVGVRQALHGGIDFQWSGAHLLSEGIDPWKTFLDGDPGHQIILGQQPNYLHELYVLLLPLGKLGFHKALVIWTGVNLVLLGVSLWLVAKLYHLSRYNSGLMAALLLVSVPLRVSLANGQQSLYALCCFAVAFTVASKMVRGCALGLGFAKYSFAPILVVVDAIRLRWLSLLGVALPIVAGLLLVWHKTGTQLMQLVMEPLRSAQIAISPGYGDLMTAAQMVLERAGVAAGRVFSLSSLAGLVCAVAFAIFVASKRLKPGLEVAVIVTLTLFCFKHLIYDYVFLVFPLAAMLALFQRAHGAGAGVRRSLSRLVWVPMLYLLLFGTVQNRLHLNTHPGAWLGFVLSNGICLLVVAFALLRSEGLSV